MLEMNWNEQIINGLQQIRKVCTCSSCGSNEFGDDFGCDFCGNVNQRLKEEAEKFSQTLSEYSKNQLDNPFIVVSLKKLGNNLKFVSSFDTEEVDEAYLAWANKILAGEITDSDYDALLNLFDGSQMYQNQAAVFIQNKILIETVTHQKQYPYEVVVGSLYQFFYQILKPCVKNCEIEAKVLDENISGEAWFDRALISEDDIQDFIENGGSSIINTIGHEACHIYQNYKRTRNIVENVYDLFMAYDQIVNSRRDGVYEDNYYKQFAEIDARIRGYVIEERFLGLFGLTMPDAFKKQQDVDCALWLDGDTSRAIEGEEVELEEEVLAILNNEPDLYNHFPQFRYEFVRDGDEIRWKTKQELVDEYLCFDDKSKDNLYMELIKRSNVRKQRLQKESKII